MVDDHYTEPIHDPAEIQRNGESVKDSAYRASAIVSASPEAHVRKIKAIEQLGATAVVVTVVVMNTSGADPVGALRTYGERILPQLRDGG